MQGLDVLLQREVAGVAHARALDGGVEGAQSVDLHLLALQEHLDETGAELLQHAQHHVAGIDGAVLCDVTCHLARVERLGVFHLRIPLAVALGHLVVRVFLQSVIDLCHNF